MCAGVVAQRHGRCVALWRRVGDERGAGAGRAAPRAAKKRVSLRKHAVTAQSNSPYKHSAHYCHINRALSLARSCRHVRCERRGGEVQCLPGRPTHAAAIQCVRRLRPARSGEAARTARKQIYLLLVSTLPARRPRRAVAYSVPILTGGGSLEDVPCAGVPVRALFVSLRRLGSFTECIECPKGQFAPDASHECLSCDSLMTRVLGNRQCGYSRVARAVALISLVVVLGLCGATRVEMQTTNGSMLSPMQPVPLRYTWPSSVARVARVVAPQHAGVPHAGMSLAQTEHARTLLVTLPIPSRSDTACDAACCLLPPAAPIACSVWALRFGGCL